LAQLRDNLIFLLDAVGRNDERDVPAHGLRGGITQETLRRGIPGTDGSVQGFADDGVFRGLDNRG
jgi:hypothetical protein